MHKVFISYHHAKDQVHKDRLINMGNQYNLFVDKSVHPGDISNDLKTETIRQKIRDDYLCDSTVTILLCGEETRYRKHVDWELKSSMIDGQENGKSGILVITLPSISRRNWCRVHNDEEKHVIYPGVTGWTSLSSRADYEICYPDLPERIIDNLAEPNINISVCPMERIMYFDLWNQLMGYPERLKLLIDAAFQTRKTNQYNTARSMKMQNGSP